MGRHDRADPVGLCRDPWPGPGDDRVGGPRLGTILPQYATQADQLVASVSTALAQVGVGPDQLKPATSSLTLGKIVGTIGGLLASAGGLPSNVVW
jgi:hypothetical protein